MKKIFATRKGNKMHLNIIVFEFHKSLQNSKDFKIHPGWLCNYLMLLSLLPSMTHTHTETIQNVNGLYTNW